MRALSTDTARNTVSNTAEKITLLPVSCTNNMNFPIREPRNEPNLAFGNYWDHEVVKQENGRLAAFSWQSAERAKGWQFMHWQDAQGFVLLEGDQQTNETAQMLLNSVCEDDGRDALPTVNENETLHAYHYGDVLSGRWGWFVVSSNDPKRVLRYKGTRIS